MQSEATLTVTETYNYQEDSKKNAPITTKILCYVAGKLRIDLLVDKKGYRIGYLFRVEPFGLQLQYDSMIVGSLSLETG